MARLFGGDAEGAIAHLEHGLALTPNDPQRVAWYVFLAYAQLLAGRPAEGLESARLALAVRPKFWSSLEVLACCAVALDRVDDAKQWLKSVQNPEGTGSQLIAPLKLNNPHWGSHLAKLLQVASP
jgi:tetratricopeptide (TPR) repeat protein